MGNYIDRSEAGKILAGKLGAYTGHRNAIVLALPRGGVPVGYEIAKTLSLPLDVYIVRKLGVPWHDELAFGAITQDKTRVFNQDILNEILIPDEVIEQVISQQQSEVQRRLQQYRGQCPLPNLKDKLLILVDDGVATGATVRAAIRALRMHKPAKIILAVPVADKTLCLQLQTEVDELICPLKVTHLNAVGAWYDHFEQTSDEEVRKLLASL